MTGIASAAAAAMALVVAGMAAVGWGRLVRRLAGLPTGGPATSAALGVAAWIFLGGALNLCRLAWPVALDALIVAGLVLAALGAREAGWRRVRAAAWPDDPQERIQRAVWWIVALAILGFTAATQLSPRLYNFGDDFQKYFAHAVRMVETGTLYGSRLNALGSETLGAQALLHGFVVGHFPIRLINGVDAVFCFGLCLALAGGVAARRPALGPAALLGTLAVFLIHPQYVNVSSLYSTAALIMALVVLGADPREQAAAGIDARRSAIAPGLICAALAALKPVIIPFLALMIALSTVGAAHATRAWRRPLAAALWTSLWSAAFLAPWILLFAPYFTAGLLDPTPTPSTPVPLVTQSVNLVSSTEEFHGASYLAYTAVATGLCVYAAVLWFDLRRREAAQRARAATLAAACVAAAANYVAVNTVGVGFVEAAGALRYALPVLIGVLPVALGLGALCLDDPTRVANARRGTWLAAACAATVIALFLVPAIKRSRLALNQGSTLAFLSRRPADTLGALRAYEDSVLRGPAADGLARLQALVPAGEPVLIWIETPFLLDFVRNPIIDVNESGLGTGWARLPQVRYVIWQHRGFAVRQPRNYVTEIASFGRRQGFILARALDFHRRLYSLATRSEILVDESGFVLMRLPDPAKD